MTGKMVCQLTVLKDRKARIEFDLAWGHADDVRTVVELKDDARLRVGLAVTVLDSDIELESEVIST